MQPWSHYLPIITTVFSAWFAPQLLARWGAHRPAPHLFWWGVGVIAYGAGTLVESLTTLFGWHLSFFQAWYITGALLGGAPLAQGTAYLFFRKRTADLLAVAVLLAVATAGVGVMLSPIDYTRVEPYRLSGQVLQWHWIRAFVPFINSYAFLLLVGGAAYSAWKYLRRPGLERRGLANIYIAIGGLLPGIGGSFARYGRVEVLYVTELIGLVLIYFGFRIAVTGPSPRPVPAAA
jgi:hypothetical protein